jgi:hypothetical protein
MSCAVVGGGEGVAAASDDASKVDGGTGTTPESRQGTLFAASPPTSPPVVAPPPDPKRGARLREAQRSQRMGARIDREAPLPEDHPARAIGAVIERLDLSLLDGPIEARDEVAGAPAIDPKISLARSTGGWTACPCAAWRSRSALPASSP